MEKVIDYAIETNLQPEELKDLLIRSTLSRRRPIHDMRRMRQMCEHANLIVTARHHNKLVGVARSLTDFSYCTYLSDLAVDTEFQKQGIGKNLITNTRDAAKNAMLILLAAPDASEYYPHIGMQNFNDCYLLWGDNQPGRNS